MKCEAASAPSQRLGRAQRGAERESEDEMGAEILPQRLRVVVGDRLVDAEVPEHGIRRPPRRHAGRHADAERR